MGGFFGAASTQDCVFDLFFGIDYHSHLGTKRGGMVVYGENGFDRAIHNIENAPFRTKFDKDVQKMSGRMGIGCISDYEPQPLLVRSHHGTYAITTVSKINNMKELTKMLFEQGHSHFLEMSGGDINPTELVASVINQKQNLIEGIRLPKAAKAEMRVLSREEQRRLMTTARLAPEPAAFGIIFDMFTGLRLGELCGLRWENVDMDSRSFLICETRNRLPNHDDSIAASTTVKTTPTTKTDNSRRRVFIMDELFHDFEMYRSIQMSIKEQDYSYNPEGYVFCQENGSPYEPRTYQDLFKRCVRQAGIPDANFHSLRHTFATRSLEQGMDAVTLSRLLGHANPSITLDKYGHALDDHKRISVAKLGDIYSVRPEQKESAPAPEEEPLPMEMKMGW